MTFFSFDTSSALNGRRDLLPPVVFRLVWMNVEADIAAGEVRAIDVVRDELSKRDDEVHAWAKAQQALFLPLDEAVQRATREVLAAHPRLMGRGGGRNAADPFVIGLAMARGGVVDRGDDERQPGQQAPNPGRLPGPRSALYQPRRLPPAAGLRVLSEARGVTSACALARNPTDLTLTIAGMALGKGKTEYSGPRDISRKSGHWGLTEEAKEWSSRARRRDEAADLRHEMTDHEAQGHSLDGLTERWLRRWPDCRPIGHELRYCSPDRWVRFHSLPESKRYADTDDEYAELLRRHHFVLDELQANRHRGAELIVITVEWSFNDELEPRPAELEEAFPSEPWTNVLRERDGDDEYWTHVFVSRMSADAPALDRLLRLVADHVTSDVIVTDCELNWLYHPYDGGADVIAGNSAQRDILRDAHPEWLSAHPQGL